MGAEESYNFLWIAHSAMGSLALVTDSEGKVLRPLRSSEDDPNTSLNKHQSFSGEIDINNLSVALKLKKGLFHPKL